MVSRYMIIDVSRVRINPAPSFKGSGYLAGEFPGGITTLEGAPVSADVRVLWRDPKGSHNDGVLVAKTKSTEAGTWRIDGLNTALRYDVIGRKDGFNDVIMSNISPAVDP